MTGLLEFLGLAVIVLVLVGLLAQDGHVDAGMERYGAEERRVGPAPEYVLIDGSLEP